MGILEPVRDWCVLLGQRLTGKLTGLAHVVEVVLDLAAEHRTLGDENLVEVVLDSWTSEFTLLLICLVLVYEGDVPWDPGFTDLGCLLPVLEEFGPHPIQAAHCLTYINEVKI